MPTTPGQLTTRARVRRVVRVVALLLVLGFAAAFVVRSWSEIREGLLQLTPGALAGSLAAVLVGLVAAMLSWRAVLSGLGSHLPLPAAARVYFLGQLGKYLPGSVWPILAQAELSRRYAVPAARTAFASVTQMIIGLVTGVVAAGACLAFSSTAALREYAWLAPVALVGLVALAPPVFDRLVAAALRLARRPGVAQPLPARATLAAAGWCLVMWAAFGVHLWLLASSVVGTSGGLLLAATGAYALAWVVGFVIVVLPAGAGAREAALVLALTPWLDRDLALMLALVSRVLMLVGDGLVAGAAVVAARRTRRVEPTTPG